MQFLLKIVQLLLSIIQQMRTFNITETKLHLPVVTLSTQDDNNLLEQLKTWFKNTIKRNKYRSEMTNQTKNNNLNI